MPRGPQRQSTDDISYRFARNVPSERGVTQHNVLAAHPEHGIIGMMAIRGGDRGEQPWATPHISPIYTHPQFRKLGIAGAMYHIAHHELGFPPAHDKDRSEAGNRFAQSVSGGDKPGYIPPRINTMGSWELDDPSAMSERQSPNWMKGEKIDPTLAKALTPVKQKKSRRKQPEQLTLPGTEGF
jgi:hypothetical protein